MGRFRVLAWVGAAAVMAGCQVNAVGLGPNPSATLPFEGVKELAAPGEALVFSPASAANAGSVAFGNGTGVVYVGCGGASEVIAGPANAANPDGLSPATNYSIPPVITGPFAGLCPGNNCKDVPAYRGVGGSAGDFANDYFVRFAGHKGSNASTDYANMTLRFSSGGALGYDISAYRGMVFWARGHGNFAVNLAARAPGDGLGAGSMTYQGWNFYLRRFGAELAGDEQWKEVIVYFSDMTQDYGLAVDQQDVLKACTSLQFDQQAPFTADFRLDVDYVRFFR